MTATLADLIRYPPSDLGPVTSRQHVSPENHMTTLELSPSTLASLFGTDEPLTPRERVVLSELSENDTLEDIARRLFVSRNTVKSQVRSVYRKIGVSTRAEAIAWARDAGIS